MKCLIVDQAHLVLASGKLVLQKTYKLKGEKELIKKQNALE